MNWHVEVVHALNHEERMDQLMKRLRVVETRLAIVEPRLALAERENAELREILRSRIVRVLEGES